jgi:tetratricopeptide (TPR) repeat protein
MATVHLALGDRERARLELEAAKSLSPELPALWVVWAQYDLTNDAPTAAVEKIGRALQLDGESWQLRVQAASVFFGAGEVEAAREQAEAAIELVKGERRAELRRFLDEMLAAEEPVQAPADDTEPALMLGDPSELRLRDPGDTLELDLDP